MTLTIAALGIASAPARADSPAPSDDTAPLSVVTLNLWNDKGDWPKREAQIVATLRDLHPDVITLQEVIEHEGFPNQARVIANALGYRYVFASVDPPGKATRFGNAILTRHPILARDWKALLPLDDYRNIVHVRLAIGDRVVSVYTTHLHWTEQGGAIRARQVSDALAYIASTDGGAPSILAGDLNADMSAPELQSLSGPFADAYAAVHPDARPGDRAHSTLDLGQYPAQHLDQILLQRGAFAPISARVILDRPDASGVLASDHYGVVAQFRILPSRSADAAQPWRDLALSPDARAAALVTRMTLDEKFQLLHSKFGEPSDKFKRKPVGAIGSAAFVPANDRLGIPALQEADAGLGVTRAGLSGDGATALPANLSTASSWDADIAYAAGAMIGQQAWRKGFNVLLAGSANLQRDPRNGRNFEYTGEDPLLAGTIAGNEIRGVQDQHVVSTMKHLAMNDYETSRNTHSADIGEQAMRESDLLTFEFANEIGRPAAAMSAYNKINGTYSGEDAWLLNDVLKRDWGFQGWVMSDWGGAHSAAKAANAGLDQQSAGDVFDKAVFFDKPLRAALAKGEVPQARIDDMVHRILRSLIATGSFDHPPQALAIDFAADGQVAQRAAEAGTVLLRNEGNVLPLARDTRRIVLIGGHADAGVLSGGGSSAVKAPGGSAVKGLQPDGWPGPPVYQPSSPLLALRVLMPEAIIDFVDGTDARVAAKAAASADVAIVFATQWVGESFDLATMQLPDGQDALIAAVAAANPRTVVVLETNGPITMPWLQAVPAVLQAWYPGARGGHAIARLLAGQVSPRGRLPVSWPNDESQLPRPHIQGGGFRSKATPMARVDYHEGANVGYKWFAKQQLTPRYPFGFGLTYTRFAHSDLKVERDGQHVRIFATTTNIGDKRGTDVVQAHLHLPEGASTPLRLAGWSTVELAAGETRRVAIDVDPRLLADFDTNANAWRIPAGDYRVSVGGSSADAALQVPMTLPALDVNLATHAAMPR